MRVSRLIACALACAAPALRAADVVITSEQKGAETISLGFIDFKCAKGDPNSVPFTPHGVIGWEDHNFAGNLRDFEVTFKPGVVLYPLRLDNIVPPTRPLLEEKLQISFKQPSFLEARTEGFIKPEFNVYPILVPNYAKTDPVIGYIEPKATVGLDRLIFRHLYVQVSHNVQVESPFPYIGNLDSRLSTILLSYPEILTTLDFTDSKLHPHAGIYLSNRFQVAGNVFGGTASDIKVQPEVRGYVPIGKRITVAMRGSVGFIFPQNWGDFIRGHLNDFNQNNAPAITAEDVKDLEIDLFRGFYGGGPTSNRGYPTRGIGAYTFVPFFNPASVASQVRAGEACVDQVSGKGGGASTTPRVFRPDSCRTAVGGMSIWETSAELRILLTGPLSTATFCDAGDVSPAVADIRLTHPHLSCGAGVRYDTPVGPIRLDIGYRIPGLQSLDDDPLEATNAEVGTILGLPIAIAAGIGEAF